MVASKASSLGSEEIRGFFGIEETLLSLAGSTGDYPSLFLLRQFLNPSFQR